MNERGANWILGTWAYKKQMFGRGERDFSAMTTPLGDIPIGREVPELQFHFVYIHVTPMCVCAPPN